MNSQANVEIGGMAFKEMELEQKPTDLHAKLLLERSLRYEKLQHILFLQANLTKMLSKSIFQVWMLNGQMVHQVKCLGSFK